MNLVFAAFKGQFEREYKRQYGGIAQAATDTIKEAGAIVKERGRGSIAAAGFSRKWQNALRVDVYPQRGVSVDAAAVVRHKIPYAGVFEDGAVIDGKPYLWLPLGNLPGELTAANFQKKVGQPLRTIRRPGKPPLLAAVIRATDKRLASKGLSLSLLKRGANISVSNGKVSRGRGTIHIIPSFVGVPTVAISKKFDIRGVIAKVQSQLPALLIKNIQKLANG